VSGISLLNQQQPPQQLYSQCG